MRSKKEAQTTRIQQVRRQDIITAATKIINRDGYAATSIMSIAKEAHVSKGTIMYHFATKDELIGAIVETAYMEGAAYMKPRIDAAQTMTDKLKAYITSNIEYLAQHADQIAAVHQVILNTPAVDYSGNAVDLLELLFLRGQNGGEFGEFDARTMAVSLRFVIDGSSFYLLENPAINSKKYADSIWQMFMRATKK
ncbi:MAG TPA: TetR/AcrR family transcriptional regulator [Candidatus Saccharimonadales bacterium]|nr:TetR/AcrR family transcriptional regulator [Candidatus Saccharimonadales bacterium]